MDTEHHYWIEHLETQKDNSSNKENNGQAGVVVKTLLQMSDKTLSCNDLRIDAARRRKTIPSNSVQPPHNPQLD